MPDSLRIATACVSTLLLASCSHTVLQYRVSARDREALTDTVERLKLLADAGDASALPVAVDLDGRKALLVLVTTAVLEKVGDKAGEGRKSESDQAASAVTTIGLVALADGEEQDLDRFEGGTLQERWDELSTRVGKRLRERFDQPGGGARKRDIFKRAATAVAGAMSRGYRQRDLDDLREHGFSQCRLDDVVVSYRAGLLRYIDWGAAEWSETFETWKERLDRLHFVRVGCPVETALFIMAEYNDAPAPMILMWRFFTAEQWPKVDKGLQRMFDL